ncbi:MAG: hypothetical protein GF350_09720 [Chitinivibrionales bacterium]|nr:hypothetical protein [Chitinivibrionales bacterium]
MNAKRVIGFAVIAGSLFGLLNSGLLFADWQSLGLKERTIHCLYYDSPDRLFAGTDHGLYLRWDGIWTRVEGGLPTLPVNAIEKPVSGTLVVAAGDGSRSDGLYIGTDILDGPPFYDFKLLDWIIRPAAVASKVIPAADGDRIRLYVASDDAVFSGRLLDSTIALEKMAIPDYAFGVEQPYCAAVHVLSSDQKCYAGGYDRSPLPGPGKLLREVTADSMRVIRERSNVTVITEGVVDRAVWDGPVPYSSDQLVYPYVNTTPVLGTTDEGVVYFQRSDVIVPYENAQQQQAGTWISLGSPKDESVIDILMAPLLRAIPADQQGPSYYNGDRMYVAVAGGVYRKCDYNENCVWSEIGDIPGRPLCLAYPGPSRQQDDLYAGTGSGVYLYTDATDTRSSGGDLRGSYAHRLSSHRTLFARGVSHETYRIDGRKACRTPGSGVFLVRPAAAEDGRFLKAVTVEMP